MISGEFPWFYLLVDDTPRCYLSVDALLVISIVLFTKLHEFTCFAKMAYAA